VFVIRQAPSGIRAEELVAALTFDADDPDLSKFCLRELVHLIGAGNRNCFDVNQMFALAFSEMAVDALRVVIQATFVFKSCCCEVAEHYDNIVRLITDSPELICYVCTVISNTVTQDERIALIPYLTDASFDEATAIEKAEIERTDRFANFSVRSARKRGGL
jgi:hypothetical protein